MNCAKVLFTRFGKCLNVIAFSHKSAKVKLYFTITMEDLFHPPKHVNGMKILDRNAFKKVIEVSCLTVINLSKKSIIVHLKQYLLKIRNLKAVQQVGDKYKILIDPKKVNCWNDFNENTREILESLNIKEDNFSKISIELEYNNWSAEDLIKAVLPKDQAALTAYSAIGHIIHLNIKNNLLEYRHVIGEILLDKIPFAKTVIYKKNFINSTYRNFEMEVICGEPNFIASVQTNQCRYELDFSKVYWNTRLATEHQRIADILKKQDVLFDVFAGVGPFAIPAGKKQCLVFANDLNPESVKWLNHNITLNKMAKGYIKTFNKDGSDFILEDVKENLIKVWQNKDFSNNIHVVMNLPAIAPTFMKYFKGLISNNDLININSEKVKKHLPTIHCYFFVLGQYCKKTIFEQLSEMNLNDIEFSFHFVRKVSGSGSMHRITFTLPFDYLVRDKANDIADEPLLKRICSQ